MEIGTTKGKISKIETGTQDISSNWLALIAEALRIRPGDLMRSPDRMHPLDMAFMAARDCLPAVEQGKVIGYIESKVSEVLSQVGQKRPAESGAQNSLDTIRNEPTDAELLMPTLLPDLRVSELGPNAGKAPAKGRSVSGKPSSLPKR